MTLLIEKWPHDTAVGLAWAHIVLFPAHLIIVSGCVRCGEPIGLFCPCGGFVCAIDGDCEDE